MDDCWNRIGVSGNRTCPELNSVVHCRNCAVYSRAGRSLLERQPPQDYLSNWTSVLADASDSRRDGGGFTGDGRTAGEERVVAGEQALALMVFRVGEERLALPLRLLQEVTPPFGIHSVPERSNGCFLGLVNIRGEILLAASLRPLLGLPPSMASGGEPQPGNARMAVTAPGEEQWVIAIDEVLGIHLCTAEERKPPAVVHSAAEALTEALFSWKGRQVALLDGPRLLNSLRRQLERP
jgi:chemotaxis-related protein WspD